MINKINESNRLPNVRSALMPWLVEIILGIIEQTVDPDGNVITEIVKTVKFKGVVQVLQTEDLQFKPEGLRNWEWLQIHCYSSNVNLKNDDKIIYNNLRYKVMGIRDYSLYGYIEYHVIRDYDNG